MRFVATGCYASLADHGLDADLVVSNDQKADLISLLEARLEDWGFQSPQGSESHDGLGRLSPRTRPLVKIQDGCDNACTYCIVRIVRGRQRSRPRDEILTQIASLAQQGYHEVVLTGVHIGSYGSDAASGDDLASLVRDILSQTPSLGRLRLSSIEPWDISAGFFALWRDPRLCRHLHLPLQSGCDTTLRRMNRNYTTAQFADLVAQAREAIPGLAVTTDLIIGFPGETENAFATSLGFVERMAFARVHVFPYSSRPDTPAALMPDQIDPRIRRQRARHVKRVAEHSARAFREQFIGQVIPVLWEKQRADGQWSGLTDNYIRVFAPSRAVLAGRCLPTRMVCLEAGGLKGELVGPDT
jgi:threonylcarbamoyladenosine tRNA methylthiotransferase MtaB